MRTLLASIAIGFLMFFASCVHANTDSEAKSAFEEGKVAFDTKKFSEAADAFRKANRLKPNWKLLFNISQCEAAAKRYGLAVETFESYLAEGGDEISLERRDEVLAELKRLRGMVGSLDVRAPEGCVVVVDNIERGKTPLSGHVLMAAGKEHRVQITRLNGTLLDRMIRLSGGQVLLVEVEDKAEPLAHKPEPKPEVEPLEEETGSVLKTEEKRLLKTVGWVTVGVSGALLVGGAVTGAMALSLDDDLEKVCPGNVCLPGLEEDRDRLDTLTVTTDVLLGIGVAAAVAGVVMLIVDSQRGEKDKNTAFVPNVGPGYAVLSFGRRF
jgi:hypothetical protein